MQYIGFRQAGEVIRPEGSHASFNAAFNPLADGISFCLETFYTDSTHLNSTKHHAATDLSIEKITGPVRKMNDTTFQLDFGKLGFNNKKRSNEIWLLAYNEGDQQYKSAVQQIRLRFPLNNRVGNPQVINFPQIPDQVAGEPFVTLQAASSSGLPIHYFVKKGPAYISGDRLYFSQVPPKSKWPLEVEVVAWQYGVAGVWASARSVSRNFMLRKNTCQP